MRTTLVFLATLHLCHVSGTFTPCANNVVRCRNGGVCVDLPGDTFRCDCVHPNVFSGRYCQIGPCNDVTCENNAECKVDPARNKGSCDCSTADPSNEWQGDRCHIRRVGYCKQVTCDNGGICEEASNDNRFICRCKPGFSGYLCRTVEPSSTTLRQTRPAHSTVLKGSRVDLTCASSKTFVGNVIFRLFKDNIVVQTSTSASQSLVFSVFPPVGLSRYKCSTDATVQGTSTRVTAESAEVTVNAVDSLSEATLRLVTADPDQNTEIQFQCSYPGANRYVFEKDNVIVRPFGSDPNYIITKEKNTVIGERLGQYTCIAYVDSLSVSSIESDPVTLMVQPQKPTLEKSPVAASHQTNTDVTLTCNTASAGSRIFSFHEGTDLTAAHTCTVAADGGCSWNPPTAAPRTISYSCRVRINNKLSDPSEVQSLVVIEIPAKPELVMTPSSVSGSTSKVTFTCRSATPGVQYEFRKGGSDVKRAKGSDATYVINTVTSAENGAYTCIAYLGAVASLASNQQPLSVKPTQPTLTTNKIQYEVGEKAALKCITTSTGTITYRFFKDGVALVQPGTTVTSTHKIILENQLSPGKVTYTCTAEIGGDTSERSAGWAIHVIATSSTCKHLDCGTNGYCKLDGNRDPSCVCTSGFEGTYCTGAVDKTPCDTVDSVTCKHGACHNIDVAPLYECRCDGGWKGEFCDIKAAAEGGHCASSRDCQNACDSSKVGYCQLNTFTCQCKNPTEFSCNTHGVCSTLCPSGLGLCLQNHKCICFTDNNQRQWYMTANNYPSSPPFVQL